MKKLPVQEERIRRAIRDVAVIDPIISTRKLQDALFEKGFKTSNNTPLDWRYVHKLRNKVHRQVVMEADREQVTDRISELKEKYRVISERLMRIAFYTDDFKKENMVPPNTKEQLTALNLILKYDFVLFNSQLDAGIFERHLGTLEVEQRNRPLSPELKALMRKAFTNWGIIPKEENLNDPIPVTNESVDTGTVDG